MCIEKATDKYDNQFVLKKVVFGTNNQLLVNGQYRDLAYDLYNKTGLYPVSSAYSKYFHNASTDMLHPNALGHQRIAQTIAKELTTISPVLTV